MTKKNRSVNLTPTGDTLPRVNPITVTQKEVFEAWDDGDHLVLAGSAGTGKTFIAMYLGLNDVLNPESVHDQLIVMRSVVPTRDQGFLPGNQKEKEETYQLPYKSICAELFDDPSAYNKLVGMQKIKFESTSYIRGVTFNNSIIVVDEMQNMNFHELDSVITRVGKNCRIIFCGDYKQSDFKYKDEREGIFKFLSIVEVMKNFSIITFGWEDIVRSGLVRDYIMTKEMLNIEDY
jgi:predicted ribonuclease YlaK